MLQKWVVPLILFALTFSSLRATKNIYVVDDKFERPIPVTEAPRGLRSLSAKECGFCHPEIYKEWSQSMHSMAWTDPYFQVDFVFDGSKQTCLNCHTPLQNQQENLVLGFRDKQKFKPILEPNPDFDDQLKQQGVTCAVCHVVDGVVLGPYGNTDAPHPVRFSPKMADGNGVCRKCHEVSGDRWDTFYRIPPCGVITEIEAGGTEIIHCTRCHMPEVVRPLVRGGDPRKGRRHLFQGGHHPEMVISALTVSTRILKESGSKKCSVQVTLENTGTDHYLPSGTPDRHLTLEFRLKDDLGSIIRTKTYTLKRTIIWQPFIIDLKDTRLVKGKPQAFDFRVRTTRRRTPAEVEVVVRYHLLTESRKRRIGYKNEEPISYVIFQKTIDLQNP